MTRKLILPVSLFVEGRKCLVVGGGRIAFRRIDQLVDAGASVLCVADEPCEQIARLAESGSITLSKRQFGQSDVNGMFIVYAATNSRDANQFVLDASRKAGILVGAVDLNWQNGDFISPAAFTSNGLTVSVATGGQSCRRSRFLKQTLSSHIELADSARLLVLGADHNTVPLETFEAVHMDRNAISRTGAMIRQVWGVHEFLLLATCNRIELHAVCAREESLVPMLKLLCGLDSLREGQFYVKQDRLAFDHTATLLAGLLSQSPGETEIVGQTKNALELAESSRWSGAVLHQWVGEALRMAREIRGTVPALEREPAGAAALPHALATAGARDPIHVIGTGTLGTALVHALHAAGKRAVWIYHNHVPESIPPGIPLAPSSRLPALLNDGGTFVFAVQTDTHILQAGWPTPSPGTAIVDLSIPRAVDPALRAKWKSATFMDLSDLRRLSPIGRETLETATASANSILHANANVYEQLIGNFQGWHPVE